MKRTLFFIIMGMMLGIAPTLRAQQGAGSISVKLNRADLKGTALNLDMDVKLDHIYIGRYESLSLTIVLKGTGQGQTLSLPPVIVNGDNKRQMHERVVALHGLTAAKKGAFAVLKNDPGLIQFLAYKHAVAYKSWMNNCQLVLVGERKNYHNRTIQSFTNILEKRIAIRRPAATGNTINLPPASNPANVNPANRQPANVNPANRQPANVNPANRPPANTNPANNNPANRQPANVNPANRPPANNNPTNRPPANVNNNNNRR
jgi:hypothetical protein